jgi:hypothetical protein
MAVFCISLPSDLIVMFRFPVKHVLHNVWKINRFRSSTVSERASASHSWKLEEEKKKMMMNLHLVVNPSFIITKVKFFSKSIRADFLSKMSIGKKILVSRDCLDCGAYWQYLQTLTEKAKRETLLNACKIRQMQKRARSRVNCGTLYCH